MSYNIAFGNVAIFSKSWIKHIYIYLQKDDPKKVGEYRSVSLCNVSYSVTEINSNLQCFYSKYGYTW